MTAIRCPKCGHAIELSVKSVAPTLPPAVLEDVAYERTKRTIQGWQSRRQVDPDTIIAKRGVR